MKKRDEPGRTANSHGGSNCVDNDSDGNSVGGGSDSNDSGGRDVVVIVE